MKRGRSLKLRSQVSIVAYRHPNCLTHRSGPIQRSDRLICPWAGSRIRTFRSTPPATFVSQLRSLSLDEYNQNRLVVISATCPKHLNERLRNPSLKRSSYHGNGSVYTKWRCEIGAFLAPVGATSWMKCCFCFFTYCLAQPLLLLQVIFPKKKKKEVFSSFFQRCVSMTHSF